jgi:hypothetical protein
MTGTFVAKVARRNEGPQMETDFDTGDSSSAVLLPASSLSSQDLARIVDQHLAARWRGDEDADHPFFQWLASCWRPESGSEPRSASPATSVLAAGGLGIRWFEMSTTIVGFVPGRPHGYYRVPRSEVPPRVGLHHAAQGARQQPENAQGHGG